MGAFGSEGTTPTSSLRGKDADGVIVFAPPRRASGQRRPRGVPRARWWGEVRGGSRGSGWAGAGGNADSATLERKLEAIEI